MPPELIALLKNFGVDTSAIEASIAEGVAKDKARDELLQKLVREIGILRNDVNLLQTKVN